MSRRTGTVASQRNWQAESAVGSTPVPAAQHSGSLTGVSPAWSHGREPTPREIGERAYYIYLARGGVNGNAEADWLQAERELREELSSASGTTGRRF